MAGDAGPYALVSTGGADERERGRGCGAAHPVATPVNLMMMGPGGYRFGDYAKLGLPVMVWFFLVAVFLVPVFWRF